MKFLLLVFVLAGLPISGQAEDSVLRVSIAPFEIALPQDNLHAAAFLQRAVGPQPAPSAARMALGKKIADRLAELLEKEKSIQIVESDADAVVTGKAFPVGGELFLAAKIAGRQNRRAFAAKTSGPLSGELPPLVDRLGNDIVELLSIRRKELVGGEK